MTLTPEGRPSFSSDLVQAFIHDRYGLAGDVTLLPGEWDQNFLLDGGQAGGFVAKIANQGLDRLVLEFQNEALERLASSWTCAKSPRLINSLAGEAISAITSPSGERFRLRLITYIDGRSLRSLAPLTAQTLESLGYALGELDRCLAGFQHPGMHRELSWDLRRAEWISGYTQYIPDFHRRGRVDRLLLQYRGRIRPLLPDLPMSVIHNDANDDNLLFKQNADGQWQFAGLYDFGDMLYSHTVNELAIACAYALLDAPDPLETTAYLASGYHQARPLNEPEIQALFPLVCMRLCVSVTNSAIAAQKDPNNLHRQVSDQQAWDALENLETIDWLAAENLLRKTCGLSARPAIQYGHRDWSYQALLEERKERIGPSLSISYEAPLVIVRGQGQFLFDWGQRAYLDCVNNVPHVGHCHPKVVAALSAQAATLNTNTRYLHPYLLEYAKRLTDILPQPLKVCFFVNSGSEANELAVRLARTYTGRRDAIVLEGGYHGNTATLVALSPYKAEGPGGKGLAEWAHKTIKPDPYRGRYRSTGEDAGRAYAEHVRETCQRLLDLELPPAFFLCEPLMGCGGQIVPPKGFLRNAFQYVRAAGGVCIADEVQIGMGRVGSHMWAFQAQGAVPDILTIGKPIGNGHPLGAVVTTPEIARSFANGMEYFSTFGGNPVSMAVGLAVLDVIEEEDLRQRAERVGRYLREGFLSLAERRPQIGDVRGQGLFMGVELIQDRQTREPATDLTAQLVEIAKADSVLLSSEGPFLNVLKIKPPMQFEETDADLLLGVVDRALEQVA